MDVPAQAMQPSTNDIREPVHAGEPSNAHTHALSLRAADLADAGDRARIDAYVHAHPDSTPFHTPAWSIAIAEGCGQRPHFLIVEGEGRHVAGVLPLTEIRSMLFGQALVSAGFAVDGGILADSDVAAGMLAYGAWQLAERIGCPSLELRGGMEPPGEGWATETGTYLGFARALAADDEAEMKAVPRKQRAEIRRSLSMDLHVETGSGPGDIAAHYAVYAESVRNLGTPVFPRSLFQAVLREFNQSADILTIRHGGVPGNAFGGTAVASVLSLYWKGTVYPYWGGGTRRARALRANDRMYFELMRHARARGCTRFDFGRSKVGTGAAAFKKNWGFTGVPLAYYTRTAEGAAPRVVNPLNPRYRLQVAAWRHLPLWVANRVGPWISRGLG